MDFGMDTEIGRGSILSTETHRGVDYIQFISQLSAKRKTKIYLEIGVEAGRLLSAVHSEIAIGVDPQFNISANVASNKSHVVLHRMTSDTFFADTKAIASMGGQPSLVFLDGLHNFEFLIRDLHNAEACCNENSLIFMHDCLPLNAAMAQRDLSVARKLSENSAFPDYWTGDVWKVIPILQKYRPDLRLVCVDCPPTGLVGVTNLNPRNRLLKDKYFEIIDEFKMVENDAAQLRQLYTSIKMIKSASILKNDDHSLYFAV